MVPTFRAPISGGRILAQQFQQGKSAGANLTGAMLQRANFRDATLAGASFKRTYMYWTRFEGADLSQSTDLTQAQLDMSCGNAQTKIPTGLTVPLNGRVPRIEAKHPRVSR